jgi:hypothetical protein
MSLAQEFTPDLADTVDAVVLLMDLLDECGEFRVAPGARGQDALLVRVVGGRVDAAVVLGERPADRLDSAEAVPVLVDERYERVCGRSSSAAKKDAAAFRISFARLSSAFSRLSALS